MTSVALAFILIYVLGYGDLGVSEALVIGSVIATTDPVAVVALLKELGASTRFRTMIEGESLLNDGTAFVFFLICMDVVKLGVLNYGGAIVQLIRLSLGGPAFGVLCGFVVTFWIKRIRKDSALISVIIIFTCYACFFVSENYLKVSGILAIVSLGIYMAGNMRVHLSHEIDHTVHSVWSFLGFSLESVIFMLSGTFIGEKVYNWDQLSLNKNDIWKALVFQVILFVVRYVVNLILLPFLNCTGYKTSLSNIFILSYGGLRGAIALSLAMLVATDTELKPQIRDVCLFYVVVTIVYTVCVSGMTIKTMMKWSGFLVSDPIKEKMTNGVLRKMILSTIREKDRMEHQDHLVGTDWEKVKQLAHLKRFEVLEQIAHFHHDPNHRHHHHVHKVKNSKDPNNVSSSEQSSSSSSHSSSLEESELRQQLKEVREIVRK